MIILRYLLLVQKTEFVENNSKETIVIEAKFLELTYFVNFKILIFIKKFNNKPKVSKKYPKYVGHFPRSLFTDNIVPDSSGKYELWKNKNFLHSLFYS